MISDVITHSVFKPIELKAFSKPNLINQIGYPPLRIDILTSIDGVSFDEAYAVKLEIVLDDDLVIKYIGLDELIKNKRSSGRKIDMADVADLEKTHKRN